MHRGAAIDGHKYLTMKIYKKRRIEYSLQIFCNNCATTHKILELKVIESGPLRWERRERRSAREDVY